jgi:mannose-6-phosphate isomerase-like protein (cupin superfamily)
MKELILMLAVLAFVPFGAALGADPDYKVVTVISAKDLAAAMAEAPADSVSDQPLSHVESAEGRLGIGVVHRPVIKAGGSIGGIQHHKQSEVYRVMAGSGTLVTSKTMTGSEAIDPEGFIVQNLTGPSDRGVIDNIEQSQVISKGDVVIIPAGLAHGFSEITEAITYMVVRIDPERLVELK